MQKRIRFKKANQIELAEYLGVTNQAISEYKKSKTGKKKVFLMLKGLQKLKEEQELIEAKTKSSI